MSEQSTQQEQPGIVESVQTLKRSIDNPLIRWVLKKVSGKCSKDGRNRLRVALELFTGQRSNACFTCSHIISPVVSRIIVKSASAFGVSRERIKERFSNPYWMTGLVSVVEGISKFGVRTPFVPGGPFLVVWDYTYKCNLRCVHCYADAGKSGVRELTSEEALRVVDELADCNVATIAFSGGEPLIRKDLFRVLEVARDYGIFTAIATNGTLLTRETVRKLKELGVGYVQISLDGATAETHDKIRGIPGVFNKTIQGIKNCVAEDFFVEVAATGTKVNYKEFPSIIKLCKELGVKWFMHFNFIPTGRGRYIVENDLTPQEREELLTMLWSEMRGENGENGYPVLSTAPQYARVAIQRESQDEHVIPTHFYNMTLPGKLKSLSTFVGGCGAGRSYCALRADGTIEPCVFFPHKVGNIRTESFKEIWDNSPVFWELRDREKLKGGCGKCEYKYVCGGCRARAYNYFGDLNAPDPGCIYNLKEWNKLVSSVK